MALLPTRRGGALTTRARFPQAPSTPRGARAGQLLQGPQPAARGPEEIGAELEQADSVRSTALAEILGFHADFVREVGQRGQEAIIDRLEESDPEGIQSKIVRLVQQIGNWMEGRMATGGGVDQQSLMQVAGAAAQGYGIEPQQATQMVAAVLQKYQKAVAQMSGAKG